MADQGYYDLVHAELTRQTERDRGIIAQSNARSASIAQAIAAVLGVAGIAAAVILPMDNVSMTGTSIRYGLIALVLLVVMFASLLVVMWPRGLGKLPKDKSARAYETRVMEIAKLRTTIKQPFLSEFDEGYFLQRIGRVKERATQVALASTLLFVIFTVLAFAFLKY